MNLNILFTLHMTEKTNWSLQIAIIMVICNLISILIGRYAIKTRSVKPSIPISGLEGLGLPELLATTSLGHIIGAGTIIGLRSIGIIS
uniref:Photosystem I reaction center subunit PsaK n=1 Tax=Dipterocladia arabiensis TaxID=2007176 RepID=A0A1Z1M0G0_9FLOR|nr:photosystem I reaction center subunit X [Dipterocladia arabiensis]ARW59341.1 photosystem I reaction center subunit X [Dipterocladia arabiensis]